MKDKLIEYCKKLIYTKKPVNIYKDLANIFDEVGLYYEQASCFKKIWHITKNNDILILIGDIYANKLYDYHAAYTAYDLYFQRKNPYFCARYKYCLYNKGYQEFKSTFDINNYFTDIVKYIDKYNTIEQIIGYLHQYKYYDKILSVIPYLEKIKEKITDISEHKTIDYPVEDELRLSDNYLSDILSNTANNIDINCLAIKLNKKNKQAYINIMSECIETKNFNQLMVYYNQYAQNFNESPQTSISDVLWKLSYLYSEDDLFYKSILCQYYAIQYDINEKEVI